MVKNLPTIERSTKIRFGKHATDDQAENTVVFNATNSVINAVNEGSIYMAPLRVAELAGSNLVGYSSLTKEIVDSSVPTTLLGGVTLDSAAVQGNVVSNSIPHFANITTAFTTDHGSNVGISNTSPTHMLSVGDRIFMSNTGSEAIKVEGNVQANKFFTGSSVTIDQNATNKIQVSGTIKTGTLHADNIGIANTSPTHALSIGNEGQLRLNVPTGSIYALETVGNVSAQNYIGDGGLLSNVTLQTVTDKSNVTSNTIHLTNPTTSLKAYSNVIVDGTLDVGSNLYVNDTAENVLNVTGNVNVSNYLKTNKLEVTSLEVDAVTAGTVSSNIIGDNVNVNTITTNVVSLNSISPGDLLVGPSSGTVLAKLAAYAPVAGSTVPANMSANSSGGNTASSSDSSANTYKAFDGNDSTNYVSPSPPTYSYSSPYGYTGSNSLGGVNGEWVKIQLASAITPTSVFVKARPDNTGPDWAVRPNSWRILGSTDGTNWIQLHASTTLVDSTNGITESFTNTTAYSYLAIVVTNINNPGSNDARWTLSRLSFTSSQSGPTEKFLRSSAAGVSWDEVSSTLQTITDGGASTNNEISFTNGVTSLTASGNVVVSGNVTTGTPIAIASGGTGLNSFTENDLLLGPSSGDALAKLSAYTGPTSITVPPSGMSSTTQTIGGIQYTSSASSTGSGTATNNAFDHNNSTIWRSDNDPSESYASFDGYYEGSSTTGSYSGAWIQLYRATAFAPTSIQIIPSQTTSIPAPNVWKVFGSTNGSSWTEIHSSSTAVAWNSGNGHTATISGSAAYNYFRLAVQITTLTSSISMGTVAVSEVRFSAPGTGPTEKFLKSSSTGISWDEVSSTLQTITDGGASTNNEISFTNGVTSLTASGNVVATGNVTASIFKSTTLSSGKIPYVNNDNELIDGPIGHDITTNNTFVSSNLYVTGNLNVQGETFFQDSNIHVISDPLIELGNANVIDTIDMGIIMTRPTANVVAGYMGDEKKYVIAYTHSDPHGAHIVPTNATTDQFMTLSVEGGNVLAGNVTTTGKMTADNLELTGTGVIIQALNGSVYAQEVNSQTFVGSGSGLTNLDLGHVSHTGQVATTRGGTGLTSIAQNELLLGPASGTALAKLAPYTPAGTTVEYPTSALSSSANSGETIAGITYTTTASSNQYGQIWKAFDKTTPGQNTFWHSDENVYDSTSGAYTGSKSLGGVSGEWIKLQLSTGIAPSSVNITGRMSYDNQAPDSWEILGSNDDTSWTSLLSSTVHATYNGGSGHTVSISGASAYTYLALVVKARGGTGQTAVVISELRFFASSANLSKKFLRSSGTGIAWDDVSSDLQTITDGGATTTHTVAFNNTTTGLTSAGDIDIAATKQIDYAGDVLLKSSAGAVASLKVDNAIKLDPAYASPSNNVLSFNTTTGEIYDSGGQGGSTLDNIHEEDANVAIGPSAASANLTVNTYGSNVLTVSGNVSADNITIGGLNIAASPFGLDDTVSSAVGSNVTANVLTLGGLVTSGNVDASNITISGNTTSQNIKLTNTDISATISSGTITIDAREKSYGTAPLVVSTTDVSNLVFSNLITGAQIVVPILASGGDINISKELTNVNFYAMTTDVSITQDKHALMTLSNLYGNIYMNAIGFA
jgi:hypothetical protein